MEGECIGSQGRVRFCASCHCCPSSLYARTVPPWWCSSMVTRVRTVMDDEGDFGGGKRGCGQKNSADGWQLQGAGWEMGMPRANKQRGREISSGDKVMRSEWGVASNQVTKTIAVPAAAWSRLLVWFASLARELFRVRPDAFPTNAGSGRQH